MHLYRNTSLYLQSKMKLQGNPDTQSCVLIQFSCMRVFVLLLVCAVVYLLVVESKYSIIQYICLHEYCTYVQFGGTCTLLVLVFPFDAIYCFSSEEMFLLLVPLNLLDSCSYQDSDFTYKTYDHLMKFDALLQIKLTNNNIKLHKSPKSNLRISSIQSQN